MADMWFSTWHPDFRLGLLLVVAALLFNAGSSGDFWAETTSGRLAVAAGCQLRVRRLVEKAC